MYCVTGTSVSGMVINLLETQRNLFECWQVKKYGGVCTLLGSVWRKNNSIANSLPDLVSVIRIQENVLTSMTLEKLPSALNFLEVYVLMLTAS